MSDSLYPPQKLYLLKSKKTLVVTWQNGSEANISSQVLRQFCACSKCRARNTVGLALVNVSSDIDNVVLQGGTGIQIKFADGHDRGIYPWPYLHAIANNRALEYLDGI